MTLVTKSHGPLSKRLLAKLFWISELLKELSVRDFRVRRVHWGILK